MLQDKAGASSSSKLSPGQKENNSVDDDDLDEDLGGDDDFNMDNFVDITSDAEEAQDLDDDEDDGTRHDTSRQGRILPHDLLALEIPQY